MRAVAAVAVALLISTTSHSAVAQYDQANKGYQYNHNLQPGTQRPGVLLIDSGPRVVVKRKLKKKRWK